MLKQEQFMKLSSGRKFTNETKFIRGLYVLLRWPKFLSRYVYIYLLLLVNRPSFYLWMNRDNKSQTTGS